MNHSTRYRLSALCIVFMASLFLAPIAQGVPACSGPRTEMQNDGSVVQVIQRGDEYSHWFEDTKGNVIAFDKKTKNWKYAVSSNKKIKPGEKAVLVDAKGRAFLGSISDKGKSGIKEAIAATYEKNYAKANKVIADQRAVKTGKSSTSMQTLPAPISTSKMQQDILLILIEFEDTPMTQSIDYWGAKFFDTTPGAKSIKNYYLANSHGKNFQFNRARFNVADQSILNPTNEISRIELKNGIAKVTFKGNHPGYSLTEDDNLIYPNVEKAYKALNQYIDYSSYTKHSGYINREDLHIVNLISGWEMSTHDGASQSTWGTSVEVSMQGMPLSAEPATGEIFSYTVQGELRSGTAINSSATPMGIGVATHELGHSLGLPDLYDYGYDSEGVGSYSLMAEGSWGAAAGEVPGTTPVMLDPWCALKLGFVNPTSYNQAMSASTTVHAYSQSSPSSYTVLKLENPKDPRQYFLVENRQREGYDSGLYNKLGSCNSGILIYHVDESIDGDLVEDNKYHKVVDVEEADGSNALDRIVYSGYSNHFFASNTHPIFSGATTPNSNFYQPTTLPHPEYIYQSDRNCHPQTTVSDIRIQVKSPSSAAMQVSVGIEAPVTVVFNSNGGSSVQTAIYSTGDQIIKPANPTLAGYMFAGWFKDNLLTMPWNFDVDTVTSNTTLYAKWTPRVYSIVLKSNGGTAYTTRSYRYGTGCALPTPSRSGYTFKGWYASSSYEGGRVYEVSATDMGNKTFYAKWYSNANYITSMYKSTGTWSKTWSKTRLSNKLTLSRSKSYVKLKARYSSKAKVYFKYAGGTYSNVTGKIKTVKVSRGKSKTTYMKVVSQSGKSRTYKIVVYRKR